MWDMLNGGLNEGTLPSSNGSSLVIVLTALSLPLLALGIRAMVEVDRDREREWVWALDCELERERRRSGYSCPLKKGLLLELFLLSLSFPNGLWLSTISADWP